MNNSGTVSSAPLCVTHRREYVHGPKRGLQRVTASDLVFIRIKFHL